MGAVALGCCLWELLGRCRGLRVRLGGLCVARSTSRQAAAVRLHSGEQ
ncbi:hypothetical protein [Alloactinosynnema sp. L-07]|nr:hypothetical protein [Alloactinosynnema sp. L-07]